MLRNASDPDQGDAQFLASANHAGDADCRGVPETSGSVRRGLAETARGAANEVRGLATHAALYPLGMLAAQLRPNDHPAAVDVLGTPVVQVHGYFHNRSGFFLLARALRHRGFRWVYAMNYNPIGESIPSLATRLARHVRDVQRASGSRKVHLVGHSLGGLVARWYVQELGGARQIDRCVTIGTPHDGTYAAYVGVGATAAQMRPGSELIRRLSDGLPLCRTMFVNVYSDLDALIVPASSGVLPALANVHNHRVGECGHSSILVSPDTIDTVARHLAAREIGGRLAEVRPLRARRGGDEATSKPGA